MIKKNITINKSIFKSYVIGFILSFLVLFSLHLFWGKWSGKFLSSTFSGEIGSIQEGNMDTRIGRYTMECTLGETHYFNQDETSYATFGDLYDSTFSEAKIFDSAVSSFDHLMILGLLGLTLGTIIFLSKVYRVKFS